MAKWLNALTVVRSSNPRKLFARDAVTSGIQETRISRRRSARIRSARVRIGTVKESRGKSRPIYNNVRDDLMAREITTVIKKILPYLNRLGYDTEKDLEFGEPVKEGDTTTGFTDIEVVLAGKTMFVIEAKRDTAKLKTKDFEQALNYGIAKKTAFVAITNGFEFRLFNVKTGNPLKINGRSTNIIPRKTDLPKLLAVIKKTPDIDDLTIQTESIYKPGVTQPELRKIFKRCHDAIRDIEKDDEFIFSDFSKMLFLKLLEEKAEDEANDPGGFRLPYTMRFDTLARQLEDQVKVSILSMFDMIQRHPKYGEVLEGDVFHIKNPKIFHNIVKELSAVSLSDSALDAKGSAFEYFLKFNLRGSQLGQYFTPREVVRMMIELSGIRSIVWDLLDGQTHRRVIDPACGSGGFLIVGMQVLLEEVDSLRKQGRISDDTANQLKKRIKSEVFWGADAKHMLARTAKMNMIIAGDGFTNIMHVTSSLNDDLSLLSWETTKTNPFDFVIANPPFGMSEASLDEKILDKYPVRTTKGQGLFLEKMIHMTKTGGRICTVIDEGILNTQSMKDIRGELLSSCFIDAVISLPYVTFEPNYARVSTSVLLLTKKKNELDEQSYPIFFYRLDEIGYTPTGKPQGTPAEVLTKQLLAEYRGFRQLHNLPP
jgi:type I restriction enzyme M protein